jgi:hypothetical protein
MAVRRQRSGASAGAHGWLLGREERMFRDWSGSVHSLGGARYPRHAALDDLRAGRPIVVTVAELPNAFRPAGAPLVARTHADTVDRAGGSDAYRRGTGATVTVHADDRIIEGGAADIREFLEL